MDTKITLATLASASAQDVFDQVVNHLLTQNTQSKTNDGSCAYRGEDGAMCAAGCLMSDDEFRQLEEINDNVNNGLSWPGVIDQGFAPATHADMIHMLQMVHDGRGVDTWADELKLLADEYKLQFNWRPA